MNILRTWLVGVIGVSVALSVSYALLPKGKFRTIARCTGGLLLLIALIKPLIQTDWTGILHSYDDWAQRIETQTEDYQNTQEEELRTLIAEKTAAYIEEKAASLGVVCHAQIECTEREGVPFPAQVVMDIPYHGELSKLISDELDISAVDQHWQEVAK